jgi:hypothetical protein
VRSLWLRIIAVTAVGLAVLAGVLFAASTVDRRAPQITRVGLTQTAPGDDRMALTTSSIEVVFSEPVIAETAQAAFSLRPSVAGSFTWSGALMVFTPAQQLPIDAAFVLELTAGIRDAAGNASEDPGPTFEFTTVGRPELVETRPVDGARDAPLDAPIVLRFSRLMDTTSVEAALGVEPAFPRELRWAAERLEIIPEEPLVPGQRYEITLGRGAADIAGVSLESGFSLSFTTIAAGLEPVLRLPSHESRGVAVTTPVVVVFDRALDPDTIDADALRLIPQAAGTVSAAAPDGEPVDEPEAARALVFRPSGALPPNTTFSVELGLEVRALDGSLLPRIGEWTFTTGAPLTSLANQIVFLSPRAGVTNLWSMNADGTNQRQISAELVEVVDYAVSPDGRSFVVADGRRLVHYAADGTSRRVLTGEGWIEGDPTYSPDGRTLACARWTDAGLPQGIWLRDAAGGGERRLTVSEIEAIGTSRPTGDAAAEQAAAAADAGRAPRYSSDGGAIAFVDPGGRVGIVELGTGRLVLVPFRAVQPPAWLPDSSALVVAGLRDPRLAPVRVPAGGVTRLDPIALELEPDLLERLEIVRVTRSDAAISRTAFGHGVMRAAVSPSGELAFMRIVMGSAAEAGSADAPEAPVGRPRLAASVDGRSTALGEDEELAAAWVAFAPQPERLLVTGTATLEGTEPGSAGIWLLRDGRVVTRLSEDGLDARWLP